MIVSSKKKPKTLSNSKTIIAILILFFLSSSLSFVIGKKGLTGPWQIVTKKIGHLKTTTYHKLLTPPPDKININISFKNLEKIEKKRQQALELGILIASDDDFVPAEIEFQDQKIPIKLRLKGDWTDHLEGEKWSFRVHTKDNQALFGMRRFSIQDPITRGDANEWVFLQALNNESLIALRYQLIEVAINGENKGIFALEEHFSKELLENNKRREAPILKFSEDQFWTNGLSYGFTPESSANIFYQSLIEPFRSTKTLTNSNLKNQFLQAEYLLKNFRSGSVPAEKVFDLDQWTTFFALSDIFGVRHGLVWHNLRFYLNPLTGLIEPIAFDVDAGERITYLSLNAPPEDYELTQILQDTSFQKAYLQKLEKFSKPEYLNNFLNLIDQDLKRFTSIINRERPYALRTDIFSANQEFITNKLTHTPAIHAFITQNNDLDIISIQDLPLLVNDQLLQPYEQLTLPISDIEYHFLGLGKTYQITPQPWTSQVNSTGLPQTSPLPAFAKDYHVPPGNYTLFRDLVIPPNHPLYFSPGVTLNLLNQARIISHSPIHLQGSTDQPIKIYSSDHTGQGLLVLNALETSSISYTVFDHLTNIKTPSTNVTGAVTFFQSPVKITHSSFSNTKAEDALNIIRSNFEILTSSFSNSSSDALDIDFSHGKIGNLNIINSLGDAIDLSTSTVIIRTTTINQTKDKGISAGESSSVTVESTSITNSHTGIASKDLSKVYLKLVTIQNGQIGLATYQKKPEYGPGYISSWGSIIKNTPTPYLIEPDSSLITNDAELPANQQNVYQTFYAN
jgi:hypothetical protein